MAIFATPFSMGITPTRIKSGNADNIRNQIEAVFIYFP